MGRPKFEVNKEQRKAIYELAKAGCTDQEIADQIGIDRVTFSKYKFTFINELKKGKEEGEPINIANVENALLRKACGYEYTEITEEPHWIKKDGYIGIDEEKKMRITKKVTKHVVPSDMAIFYYLGNRVPDRWQSVNHANLNLELGGDALEYFGKIASEIKKSDTSTD